MAQRVHPQLAAFHHLGLFRVAHDLAGDRILPAQKRADALDQQPLAEGFLDVVVRPHAQTQNLVDLVILGGQEDDRHRGLLTEPLQQVHPVHSWHLYVKDGHVGQLLVEGVQCACPSL
jgi:hypothetical protein